MLAMLWHWMSWPQTLWHKQQNVCHIHCWQAASMPSEQLCVRQGRCASTKPWLHTSSPANLHHLSYLLQQAQHSNHLPPPICWKFMEWNKNPVNNRPGDVKDIPWQTGEPHQWQMPLPSHHTTTDVIFSQEVVRHVFRGHCGSKVSLCPSCRHHLLSWPYTGECTAHARG